MPAPSSIIRDNLYFLDQAVQLLQRIDGAPLTEPDHPGGYRGGIGPHMRHCIDHYQCFLRGMESRRIDYNERERNPDVETNTGEAARQIALICDQLGAISATELNELVDSKMDCGDDDSWSRSTIKRELQFLISHTVHHYAIIAMTLRQHGIEPPDDFGVAPSTLKHHQARLTCAQ